MATDLIQYAFVAGELSPNLYGRSDYEKYSLGLAEARNYFVDYRGGLSTRPGMEFIDFVAEDNNRTKFVPFKYAPNVANTYVILFGHLYIRFIQDGAYVLEDDLIITDLSNNNPGVVTSVAHGYSTGDWFYITEVVGMTEVNGRLFEAGTVTANTIELKDPFGVNFDTNSLTAYVSGGVLNRVYTVVSPYTGTDLADLRAKQRRDYIRLTHTGHPIRNLVRVDHTNWTLSVEDLGTTVTRPTGLAGAAGAAGFAEVGFVVTAVNEDGSESLPSDMLLLTAIVNYANTAGSVVVTWNTVDQVAYYKVYRTNIVLTVGGEGITKGDQLGFIGRVYGPLFVDNNIIPDFTRAPPQHANPFASSSVESIDISAPGAGYNKSTTTVVVTGAPGTGFVGYPVINAAGAILRVVIIKGGSGYVAPVVTFPTGGGAGAAATANLTAASGNHPAISANFQQRQLYAATLQNPLTIYGSQPGLFSDFDTSLIVADSDAFEFDIDSEEVAPLRHMLDVRGGLLVMSQSGVWLLRGASSTTTALTPSDALADPQSYRGVSDVPPLVIDNDILYIEGKNVTVRLLTYSDIAKSFIGQDMSILSNHLFGTNKTITQWDYAQNPYNLIIARRSDGKFLFFTLVKEQDVFAWTPQETQGEVKDVCVVHEGGRDSIYLMVQRFIDGRHTRFIERMAPREFTNVEDAFCVDAGLVYQPVYPDSDLEAELGVDNSVIFEAQSAIFTSGDVDKVLRFGGGKVLITGFIDTQHLLGVIQREITDLVPETTRPARQISGNWTLDAPFSTLTGLHHLEGETVKILADGNVMTDQVVTDGEINLGVDCTRAAVGLKYTCRARTLPISAGDVIVEGKRKSVIGTAVRLNDTRGLKVGSSLNKLYPMKERTDEAYGEATRLQSGYNHVLIESQFDDEGQTYYVQEEPLPATILGIVLDVDLGDNPDPGRRR